MALINIALAQMANAQPTETVGAAMSQEKVDRSPLRLHLRKTVLYIHPGYNCSYSFDFRVSHLRVFSSIHSTNFRMKSLQTY